MVDPNVWWNRLGAVSGLIAGVVLAAGFGVTGAFDGDIEASDSAQTIANALAHRDIGMGPVIVLAGMLIFLVFASYLRRHIMRAHDSWLVDLFYGGALLVVAAVFAFAALSLSMDALDDPRANPEIAAIATLGVAVISVLGICEGWRGAIDRELVAIPGVWTALTAARITFPPSQRRS